MVKLDVFQGSFSNLVKCSNAKRCQSGGPMQRSRYSSQNSYIQWCKSVLRKNVGKMVVDPFSNQIFFDWEMEMVEHFLQLLHSVSLHVNSKNKLVWTASQKGIFSIKSYYNYLCQEKVCPFWSERFGLLRCCPIFACFFIQRNFEGKFSPNEERLEDDKYCLSKQQKESTNHISFNVNGLLSYGHSCFRVAQVLPWKVVKALAELYDSSQVKVKRCHRRCQSLFILDNLNGKEQKKLSRRGTYNVSQSFYLREKLFWGGYQLLHDRFCRQFMQWVIQGSSVRLFPCSLLWP